MTNRFHIHEAVSYSTVRMYEVSKHSDDPYKNQEDYEVVLSIHYEKPDVVFIFGWLASVKLTRADLKGLRDYLKSKGVKVAKYYRRGKLITKEL